MYCLFLNFKKENTEKGHGAQIVRRVKPGYVNREGDVGQQGRRDPGEPHAGLRLPLYP